MELQTEDEDAEERQGDYGDCYACFRLVLPSFSDPLADVSAWRPVLRRPRCLRLYQVRVALVLRLRGWSSVRRRDGLPTIFRVQSLHFTRNLLSSYDSLDWIDFLLLPVMALPECSSGIPDGTPPLLDVF